MMNKWTLAANVSLSDKLFEISMMELRASPGDVMSAVELGATFLVKRAGKVVAVLQKPPAGLVIIFNEHGEKSYSL